MANGSNKNCGSPNNPDALADKIYQVAFNYVNFCRCNKTASLRKWYEDNDFEWSTNPVTQNSGAQYFFKKNKKELDKWIEKFREENRETNRHLRDTNIATLNDIALNGTNKDKIAAIKELNSICGFNNQNLNINGKVDKEIIVEITNL